MGKNEYTFIDLFSGAGGLLRGFMNEGYRPLVSLDVWQPAIDTHKLNYPDVPIIESDIRRISNDSLLKYKDITDVVVGGPPCQGFSTIGKRLVKDPRNELVFEFIRFVSVIQPRVFLMENVRGLLSSGKGEIKQAIEREFKEIGYNIISQVLCAADFGVPQRRYRLFFLGVRKDINVALSFPAATTSVGSYATVGETIMDLVGKENQVPNHVPLNHNPIVVERMKFIEEGHGIPREGLPQGVNKGSRSDFLDHDIKNFSHVFKRLSRNLPATTMVPGHNAFPLHPTENRSLTVREAARIQTFPDDVVFCGSRQNQCIQVGNAVPVKLAEVLAEHIKKILSNGTNS